MKKFLPLLFLLVFILSMSVFAVEYSDITLDYSLTCDGEHSKTVPKGTVITVEYTVENITNQENFNVYVIQNEIYYDHHFFELDENSFDLVIPTVTAKLQKPEGENNKLIHEIYMNDRTTQPYQNCQTVGRFKLKVIADSGSSTIKSTSVKAYADGNTMYKVSDSLSHLTITVGEEGTPSQTASVSYISNGIPENIQAGIGEEITLKGAPSNAPSGKVFDYWKAENGDKYYPGDKFTVLADTTFVAVWKDNTTPAPVKYTLTFNTNEGSEIEDVVKIRNTTVNLSKYITVKEGFSFDGWYTDAELTNKVEEVKMTSNITLWAKWIEGSGSSDVTPSYKPDILTNEHYAYIMGRDHGMIYPNEKLTRAEAATIFFRLLDEDVRTQSITQTNGFADVDADDWYNTAVSTLASLEILNGRGNNMFAPDETITRAEFTTIVSRLSEASYSGKSLFSDISTHWAEEYINIAASIGWVNGSDGQFRPDDSITRAEVMAIVNRALNRLPEKTNDMLPEMKKWKDNMDETAWYYIAVQEATNSHTHIKKADKKHEKWVSLTDTPDWISYENQNR